jgi:hypothetical protein
LLEPQDTLIHCLLQKLGAFVEKSTKPLNRTLVLTLLQKGIDGTA